jgi:adenylyltransferase/sulfurtransferase
VDYEQFCGVSRPHAEGDAGITQLEPEEAQSRIAGGAYLLDVRNPDEWARGRIAGATLVPLPELSGRIEEIPADREIVVYCRSGPRSNLACQLLAAAGHPRVANLRGGILAWADSIDPSLPRY